jgi:thiamine biosynthesis lipoprotein
MNDYFSFPFPAMGSECVLHIYAQTSEVANELAQAMIEEVIRIEQRYSRFRPDSWLCEINRMAARGGTLEVDEETAGLLDYAFACHKMSGGLFDISAGSLYKAWDFSVARLPEQGQIDALLPWVGLEKIHWSRPFLRFTQPGMSLDFGGIGKEYAADRIADLCLSNGIEHGLIDLAGDIRIIGPHPDGSAWRIGLRDPAHPESSMAVVEIKDGGIATSGDYERYIEVAGQRYCHILNPKNGWPVRGLSSVSVVADSCLVAGSIATIGMLKERDAIAWLESLGVAHAWVDNQGKCGGNLLGT